jgi:hypothetical protein
VQRWLSAAMLPFDTSTSREIVRLLARAVVVCGGAAAGTLTFVLLAGVLGVRELGPLSKIYARVAPRQRAGGKYFKSTKM